jgi:hypothetical protein
MHLVAATILAGIILTLLHCVRAGPRRGCHVHLDLGALSACDGDGF